MSLAREVYGSLQGVFGSDNISEEPAKLDFYAYKIFEKLLPMAKSDRFGLRPEAVELPNSREEVQAIITTCNRYKTKIRTSSTG